MNITLQMEFLPCQETGRLSHAKAAESITELLALLLLWEAVRLEVRNETGCDQGITRSAIAAESHSTHSSKKCPFRLINYLHPSRAGLKLAIASIFLVQIFFGTRGHSP